MSSWAPASAFVAAPAWRTLTLALVAGLAGAVTSRTLPVLELEEAVGLERLYALRGERPSPDAVALVGISSESADRLGLSVQLDEWPRDYHAQVIDQLARAGAKTIVFDVAFEVARDPGDDAALVRATGSAGNVVLLERTQDRDVDLPGLDQPGLRLSRIPLLPEIDAAALATAPFTLPRYPFRTSQFWVFGNGASDTPTLPAVALQAFLVDRYGDLVDAIQASGRSIGDLPRSSAALRSADFEVAMRGIRRLFLADRGLGGTLLADLDGDTATTRNAQLRALVAMYSGADSRYLNFYGPSGTIATIPFDELLGSLTSEHVAMIAGKAVFVGVSERRQSEQQDEFISVYSERSGLSLSGVEIGATAFANLLLGDSVRPLSMPGQLALLFFAGAGLAALLAHLRIRYALPLGLVLGAVYVVVAVYVFESRNVWLPLVVPVGMQLPFVLGAVTLSRYRDVSVQRERIQRALGRYVHPAVIDRLTTDALDDAASRHELLRGTCLVTDVEQYTELAERLPPAELAELMAGYFRALSQVVEAHGGHVVDTSGDSMVALWAAGKADPSLRRQAVAAACALREEVDRFNLRQPHAELPTAVGLEYGEVAVGKFGPGMHDEYRAVGDIVNTAARIQGLSRHLGTRILLSESALADVPVCSFRRIGRFLVLGKRSVVEVHECLSNDDPRSERVLSLQQRFAEALVLFAERDFARAREAFLAIDDEAGGDGPSRFYAERCNALAGTALGPDWAGTIVLKTK